MGSYGYIPELEVSYLLSPTFSTYGALGTENRGSYARATSCASVHFARKLGLCVQD